MLEIEMNGKVYPFKFGVGFLSRANARYKEIQSGMVPIEIGFKYLVARAEDGYADAIVDMLVMAAHGQKPCATRQTIEDYIDDEADVDALWEEIKGFLFRSAACKKLMTELTALMKAPEAEQ